MKERAKFFVIQMGRMGDVVQSLPLLKRLRDEKFPCEITLLCIREPAQLLGSVVPVDRFVSIPYGYYKKLRSRENPSTGLRFLLEIAELRESYDLVINLTHDLLAASLCYNIRSRKKSGLVQDREGRVSLEGDWGKYLFSVATDRNNRAQNLINLVDIHIGMGGLRHQAMEKWLETGEEEEQSAEELLVEHGWKRRGKLVAFQMGANQPHRAWPVGHFARLGETLTDHPDVETVLLGAPGESGLGEEFLRKAPIPAVNLIGKSRVSELPAILTKCDLLVSNDTGTAHIAAAVGTRVLGLYFSTAFFGETAPFGGGHVVLQVETECTPCLKDRCQETWCRDYLCVEAVQASAKRMLFGRTEPLSEFPNLSIYESRFLSNGTLIYLPAAEKISERYQNAFLNRILWENALGLEHDEKFLAGFGAKLLALESFRSTMEAVRTEYASLSSHYHETLKTLYQAALAGNLPDAGKIGANGFTRNSLLRAFHRFEMMGLGGENPLEAHRELIQKHAKLNSMVNASLGILEAMASEDFPGDLPR